MNGAVHYGHTRRWALEEGFSDATADGVARADIGVDRKYPGNQLRYWGWHFLLAGASLRAHVLNRRALETGDPLVLGEALHCTQDAIAHGLLGHLKPFAGIDTWEARSARVRRRIEDRSRRMLRDFLSRHPEHSAVA